MTTPILHRSAVTLLEVTISLAILTTVTAMVTESISMGVSMHEHVGTKSDVVERANVVVKKIAYQLRSADYNWITITEGPVATYQFTLCTGLSAEGPVFNQGYALSYDSAAGTLTATLTDNITKQVLQQDVAKGLRRPDPANGIEPGFQLTQLGTSVVVTGNQMQLAVAIEDTLVNGEVLSGSAQSVVFLRSTMYANANLTRTVTEVTVDPPVDPTEDPPVEDPPAPSPIILLGSDTDTTTKQIGTGPSKITVNNLLVKGTVSMPTGTSATIDYSSFNLTTDKLTTDTPQKVSYTVARGWIKAENPGNKLSENEYVIYGWVAGSLAVTVTVSNTEGASSTVTANY